MHNYKSLKTKGLIKLSNLAQENMFVAEVKKFDELGNSTTEQVTCDLAALEAEHERLLMVIANQEEALKTHVDDLKALDADTVQMIVDATSIGAAESAVANNAIPKKK